MNDYSKVLCSINEAFVALASTYLPHAPVGGGHYLDDLTGVERDLLRNSPDGLYMAVNFGAVCTIGHIGGVVNLRAIMYRSDEPFFRSFKFRTVTVEPRRGIDPAILEWVWSLPEDVLVVPDESARCMRKSVDFAGAWMARMMEPMLPIWACQSALVAAEVR